MDRAYWEPLVQWMRSTLLKEHGTISASDLDLFMLTDDVSTAVAHIVDEAIEAGPLWEQPQPRPAVGARRS
jgi:hypothetical protein